MSIPKVRQITNTDKENIQKLIKENGIYQVYYSLKNKTALTRQDRLLLGYINPSYLRNNDMLDTVTIPVIQKALRMLIPKTPEQIQKGVIELEKQNQEKLLLEEEQRQNKLLERDIFKTIRIKGTYPYSDGEGFSTTMHILLQLSLDKHSKLLLFEILDLQPQHSFYEICDYGVAYKKLESYLISNKGKLLKDVLSFVTILSQTDIKTREG